jgi:secondary thiamine-phosphate synthase enzyme
MAGIFLQAIFEALKFHGNKGYCASGLVLKSDAMRQSQKTFEFRCPGRGLVPITSEISGWVAQQGIQEGLLTLFIQHTSASLVIQENADPDVQTDLNAFFDRLAPDGDALYRHTAEGPDDMPAHVRSALTHTQLSIPVSRSHLALGTWQGIYVFEHRHRAHTRRVVAHLIGA